MGKRHLGLASMSAAAVKAGPAGSLGEAVAIEIVNEVPDGIARAKNIANTVTVDRELERVVGRNASLAEQIGTKEAVGVSPWAHLAVLEERWVLVERTVIEMMDKGPEAGKTGEITIGEDVEDNAMGVTAGNDRKNEERTAAERGEVKTAQELYRTTEKRDRDDRIGGNEFKSTYEKAISGSERRQQMCQLGFIPWQDNGEQAQERERPRQPVGDM